MDPLTNRSDPTLCPSAKAAIPPTPQIDPLPPTRGDRPLPGADTREIITINSQWYQILPVPSCPTQARVRRKCHFHRLTGSAAGRLLRVVVPGNYFQKIPSQLNLKPF